MARCSPSPLAAASPIHPSRSECITARVSTRCLEQAGDRSTLLGQSRSWDRRTCHAGNHLCCCAQAAALLATAEGLLREAEDAAERREEVLDRLQELEVRREEAAWLAAYEADDGRYKVCPPARTCKTIGAMAKCCTTESLSAGEPDEGEFHNRDIAPTLPRARSR